MLSIRVKEQTLATQRDKYLLLTTARVFISGQKQEGRSQLRDKGRLKPIWVTEK